MKSVLISIRPKWCELIMSGKKGAEVRLTAPSETPFRCYIYCTHGDPTIYVNGNEYVTDDVRILSQKAQEAFERVSGFTKMNGKVVGEFVCDTVFYWSPYIHDNDTITLEEISDLSCVDEDTLIKYADGRYLKVLKISNLVIYDKPKDLRELDKPCMSRKCPVYEECGGVEGGCIFAHHIRPPQSWCYVEKST